jgi:hypothetical protein
VANPRCGELYVAKGDGADALLFVGQRFELPAGRVVVVDSAGGDVEIPAKQLGSAVVSDEFVFAEPGQRAAICAWAG